MKEEELWNAYRGLLGESDMSRAVTILQQCLEEGTDPALLYCAGRDLGMLYARDDSGIKDLEKAKQYLRQAALEAIIHGYEKPEIYDEIACQTLGQLLFAEGDLKAFYFQKEALKLGSLWAAWSFYRELKERTDEDAFTRLVQENIQNEISSLCTECRDAIAEGELPAVKSGVPQFALAIVGLYRLGDKVGIDEKQGLEYLTQSRELGNKHAEDVFRFPDLQKPESFLLAAEKLQKGCLEPEESLSQDQRRAKKGTKRLLPAILLVLAAAVVLYLARDIIFSAVKGFLAALAGVGSIIILVVCLYIYGEDGGGQSKDSGWQIPKDTGFSFPSHLRDHDGHLWDLTHSGRDNATYYCPATGASRFVYASDFEDGLPSGFYGRG